MNLSFCVIFFKIFMHDTNFSNAEDDNIMKKTNKLSSHVQSLSIFVPLTAFKLLSRHLQLFFLGEFRTKKTFYPHNFFQWRKYFMNMKNTKKLDKEQKINLPRGKFSFAAFTRVERPKRTALEAIFTSFAAHRITRGFFPISRN